MLDEDDVFGATVFDGESLAFHGPHGGLLMTAPSPPSRQGTPDTYVPNEGFTRTEDTPTGIGFGLRSNAG